MYSESCLYASDGSKGDSEKVNAPKFDKISLDNLSDILYHLAMLDAEKQNVGFEDCNRVRYVLEVEIAALAAERADEDDLKALELCLCPMTHDLKGKLNIAIILST